MEAAEDPKETEALSDREDSFRVVLKALVGKLCFTTSKPAVAISAKQLEAADERYTLRYCTAEDGSVTLWLEKVGERTGNILAPESKIILAR